MIQRISLKFAGAKTKVIKIIADATGQLLGVTAITLQTRDEFAEEIHSNTSGKAKNPSPGGNLETEAECRGGL
jgi:hypothetical protein